MKLSIPVNNEKESDDNWYYANNDTQIGPIRKKQLYRMLKNGELDPVTIVWAPSLKDWTPAIQVESFRLKTASSEISTLGSIENHPENLHITGTENSGRLDLETQKYGKSHSSNTRNTQNGLYSGRQSKIQQVFLFTVAGISAIMMLFPPFKIEYKNRILNMGYAFLFEPPKRGFISANVNVEQLLVQLLILFSCGICLWFAIRSK
jgi:hypothetical protein